jgi:Mce-associated membrane protein
VTNENTDDTDVVSADEPEATGTEPESTAAEETAAEPTPAAPAEGKRRRRRLGTLIGAGVLSVLLLASAGVTAWLYFSQFRPDQQTDAAAREVALEAAKSSTVALLSYSPETLDRDFANAKSNLTGEFLDYYTQFTEQIVTPAAKQKQVKTSAAVVQAAVAELQPDSAVVLVFVNQNTVSKENPDGAFAASAVKVAMEKRDGRWLINAFDPV